MDADFDAAYRSEQRIGTIFFVFTALAITIACLGIFCLAAYSAERRSKEIGVRKVLGATVPSIIGMLSKDFIRLVFIAILIASPLAWFSMQKWLQEFAYRVSMHWWMLAIGGLTAILIALFTVSFQAVKAAIANPVKSLRTE
jgi:putative ABC transport system permease protein